MVACAPGHVWPAAFIAWQPPCEPPSLEYAAIGVSQHGPTTAPAPAPPGLPPPTPMIEPLPRMTTDGALIDTLPDIATAAEMISGAV